MKRSSERILTTHTGSLPRPTDLAALLQAKETGELKDMAGFAARVKTAVAEAIQHQAKAGVDIVNDGEMGKPSYSTYVKDRLSGFGGEKELAPAGGGSSRISIVHQAWRTRERGGGAQAPLMHGADRLQRYGGDARRFRQSQQRAAGGQI